MHTLEHLLGLCGESHPNIYTIIFFLVFFKIILYIYRKLA
jgi:hypothetical protein